MTLLQYLQLQPLEPNDDGTSDSPLDDFQQDDIIDLSEDIDGEALQSEWQQIVGELTNDPNQINFDDK